MQLGTLAVRRNIKLDLLPLLRPTKDRSSTTKSHLISGSRTFDNEKLGSGSVDHAKHVWVKGQRKLHHFGVTFADGFTSNAVD